VSPTRPCAVGRRIVVDTRMPLLHQLWCVPGANLRMNKKSCVLITSAGRRVALMESIRADARSSGLAALICAADQNPGWSSACSLADHASPVPRCTDPAYVDVLLALCREHGVQLVIPTIDTELPVLAVARDRFEQVGARVAISAPEAVAIARDKLRTARVLGAAGVPTPATEGLEDVLAARAAIRFPAVLKHIDGSRSIGLHFADSLDAAAQLSLPAARYVAQERCVGPEYTVNCYVDRQGELRAAVPHRRIEVRDGEVSKGITERRADLTAIAHKIAAAIPGLRGPFCFQAILTPAGPKVFEINARFGGGYPLAHAAGATFGKWLLEEALGLPCAANDEWQDGLLMLRYDAAVFVKP